MDRDADTVLDAIADLHRCHLGFGAHTAGTRRGRDNRNFTELGKGLGVGRR